MTITEVQNALRSANNLPFGYPIEDGAIHARFLEVDQVAYMFGDPFTRKFVASAEITDKGFVWTQ